ncbi:MAG: hypothetical protein HZB19_19210 [Chloroflexi bacterium]|nr:hypothetical protein [Chloroflexota bacterium]
MNPLENIADYFEHIVRLLDSCQVVQSHDVQPQERTVTEGYLRGEVLFTDGTRLHFRELVSIDPSVQLISYAYQYMRADGTVIFRYDDTDHFPNLPTAPHHKHIGETEVIAADAPDLQSVLKEIEGMIKT